MESLKKELWNKNLAKKTQKQEKSNHGSHPLIKHRKEKEDLHTWTNKMLCAFPYLISAFVVLANQIFPVKAVTDGMLDGDGHPFVGLMLVQDDGGKHLSRCSGTLLSSKVFLTAEHCIASPVTHVEIWFDTDVDTGIPANGYPYTGNLGGMPHIYQQYDPDMFYVNNVSVIILDNLMTYQIMCMESFRSWISLMPSRKSNKAINISLL
jgi:hypothetical protein